MKNSRVCGECRIIQDKETNLIMENTNPCFATKQVVVVVFNFLYLFFNFYFILLLKPTHIS